MKFKCRITAQEEKRMAPEMTAMICLPLLLLMATLAGCGKAGNESSESVSAPELTREEGDLPPTSGAPRADQTAKAHRSAEEVSSDELFKQGLIPRFRIQASQNCLNQLRSQPRVFVRVDVQVDDVLYRDVGMHLKGRSGSFRPLDSKPGLTLKFNKFRKGQRFHGLEKIHLNNEVQDPSFMTEIICSQMFREAGVPAARATNARLELNGRTLGFYVLVEGVTEDFLGLYFENTQGNLYDFPYRHDINSPAAKESNDREPSDLRALAAAVKEQDLSERWRRLGRLLDLDRFVTYLALEVMIWDWDCYAMCRNNYRVYHDPASDKLVFMPHGMDQIFDNPRGSILPQMKGMIAKGVLEIPEGRRLYFERMRSLSEKLVTNERMTQQLNALRSRIRPVLHDLNPSAARRHDQAVARLEQHIQQRIASVRRQLAQPPTEPVSSSHFP
jgi:hypothetical protein